jgi:hypothetical protein
VYNDESNTAINILTRTPLPRIPTIVTGDFNLHHPFWSLSDTDSSPAAEAFMNWVEDHHFTLLNEAEEITFERGSSSLVLDLTWANHLGIDHIGGWRIHANSGFASDHFPITWTLLALSEYSTQNITPDSESTNRFRFSDSILEAWEKEFERILDSNPPVLTDNPLLAQLDKVISILHTALHGASIKTATPPPRAANPSPWFAVEVKQALKVFRVARKTFNRKCSRNRPAVTNSSFAYQNRTTLQ